MYSSHALEKLGSQQPHGRPHPAPVQPKMYRLEEVHNRKDQSGQASRKGWPVYDDWVIYGPEFYSLECQLEAKLERLKKRCPLRLFCYCSGLDSHYPAEDDDEGQDEEDDLDLKEESEEDMDVDMKTYDEGSNGLEDEASDEQEGGAGSTGSGIKSFSEDEDDERSQQDHGSSTTLALDQDERGSSVLPIPSRSLDIVPWEPRIRGKAEYDGHTHSRIRFRCRRIWRQRFAQWSCVVGEGERTSSRLRSSVIYKRDVRPNSETYPHNGRRL
ncbi:hypothetical protein BDV98DRAFT_300287 [Pterulicium gracile]|uniref:Uncharacterized protein n=1 Tax=Pterulicium gracile TaxID=1884261 RepID=A0A5C3Q3S5_9AGAR|nr:hypothetical protein BDV98DRAFT_300287 [Pterula gracilis]